MKLWCRLVAIPTGRSFLVHGFVSERRNQPYGNWFPAKFRSEKLDVKKLYQAKRMRQRAALDLFSTFTSLNSRGYFGEPLKHVRTPHVSRQSNVAMKDGLDIVMRSSSALIPRFLRRKPYEQQRSLKGPVFHRIGHLKKSQKSKRRDLSILLWTWRSKKRKRTAPMRSWTSTVAVMQKNPCPAAFSQSTVCEFVGDGK